MKHTENNPLIKYWSSDTKSIELPVGQLDIKRRWRAVLMLSEGHEVTEYSVAPQSRTTLTQMLDIITEKTNQLSTSNTSDCGFKVW